MQASARTVAFQGIDVLPVDVQVLVAPGNLAFAMVGLADKAAQRPAQLSGTSTAGAYTSTGTSSRA